MEAPEKLEKYTAKHVSEIMDRIAALRMRWLRHVRDSTRIAAKPLAPCDRYKLSSEAAE